MDSIRFIHFGVDHSAKDYVRTCVIRVDYGTSAEEAQRIVMRLAMVWPEHKFSVIAEKPTEFVELLSRN